ncbi:Plant transposon protein [Fragilaria crotonensis]|nr:Plant transposon protein [Fragilaria crotonensis]
MILFLEGGDFSLENDVLHIVEEDEEEQEQPAVWGGSRPGKAPNLERHRVMYSHLLYNDFWGPTPVYNDIYFKKFFKLPIGLFDEIVERIALHDPYFTQKRDASQKLGFTALQKVCSAVRLLTSGVSPTEHNDKYRMATTTGMECMKRFCHGVNAIYGDKALRHPTSDDINRLLDEGNAVGFPGCIGSIDCMHWQWKNCPSAWKGMFQGKEGVPTMILEAISDHSTRFWHFNFGSPGALNDINVLDWSPLFYNAVRGEAPRVDFTVNHHQHSVAYWLADGIYPTYACFVKTIPNATTRMPKLFVTAQEAKRKDIEQAFGILQSRFHVLTSGCRLWDREAMDTVIRTCVVLHNKIIDYEREHSIDGGYINDANYVPLHHMVVLPRDPNQSVEEREVLMGNMQNAEQHNLLQHDLMVERWERWIALNGNDDMEDGILDDGNILVH